MLNDKFIAINILRLVLHTKFYNNMIFTEQLKDIPELESFSSIYIPNKHTVQIKIKKTYLKKKYNMDLNDTTIYYNIFTQRLLHMINMNLIEIEEMYNAQSITSKNLIPLHEILNPDCIRFLFNVTVMSENIINFHL